MKALITTNYIYLHLSNGTKKQYESHKRFCEWITANKGKWVDIDTNCVFNNQYNTVDGFRIYDEHIDCIVDDVRTDLNVFFVKYPNGKNKIKKVDFQDKLKNKRFYSCHSVNDSYYRISRRSSLYFILAGETNEIYICNGKGYSTIKDSGLSDNEIKLLDYCRQEIITNY